jgi:hypothetical protein
MRRLPLPWPLPILREWLTPDSTNAARRGPPPTQEPETPESNVEHEPGTEHADPGQPRQGDATHA